MKNIELIFREVLYQAIEAKKFTSTQSELSKKLGISLSIVNSALKKLERIGAVKINRRSFQLLDVKKTLYLWASLRNLEKDIIFKARIESPVREIERAMPNILFTAFTGYKLLFNDIPADYSEVYAYADKSELEQIKKRVSSFKLSEDNPNFFILKKDNSIKLYPKIPKAQLFVDLWNLKQWYAKEFITALESKL